MRVGTIELKRVISFRYNPKIQNLEEWKEFVQKHSSQTQKEMAEAWGEKISDQTIGKALKKIGFSRKKKLTDTKKGLKKKEENFT